MPSPSWRCVRSAAVLTAAAAVLGVLGTASAGAAARTGAFGGPAVARTMLACQVVRHTGSGNRVWYRLKGRPALLAPRRVHGGLRPLPYC